MPGSETVQLLDYMRAVRERWRLVAIVVLVCTGSALAVSLSGERQYDATAQLLLRGDEPINSLLDPTGSGGSRDPERDLNTQVQLIKLGPTIFPVLRRLGLTRSADELIDQIEAKPDSTSDVLELRVRDRNPLVAARIANAFAEEYVLFRRNSARQRYRDAADLATRQLEALSARDRDSAQGLELQARERQLQVAAALQTGGAELVRRASVPAAPSRPRPKLSGALGGVLGLLLGVGAALGLSLADRRLKDEHELEEHFGLPILAAIPRPARRAQTEDDPAQREAYGLLAANMRAAAGARATPVMLITSPSPGDGKTSVTIGVARAYARLGLRVLAIEADLRRPAFDRYFDVSDSAGLTGVLGGSTVTDELLWVDAETLQPAGPDVGAVGVIAVLPAGDTPANAQRTLSDPRIKVVIQAARSMADVVLIDSAPVGTVNDAAVLVPHVHGVVLVARLNQTTKDAGRRALRTLRNLGTEMLGVVATDAAPGERHMYYSSPAPPTPVIPVRAGRGGAD